MGHGKGGRPVRKQARTKARNKASKERNKHSQYVCRVLEYLCLSDRVWIKFVGKIPSVNMLTTDVHKTRRRVPTTQVKKFKNSVIKAVKNLHLRMPEWGTYNIDYVFWFPCKNADGSMRKIDTDNFIKIPTDAIATGIGIDDSYFMKVTAIKQHSLVHEWAITITKGIEV